MRNFPETICAVLTASTIAAHAIANAPVAEVRSRTQPLAIDSGKHNGAALAPRGLLPVRGLQNQPPGARTPRSAPDAQAVYATTIEFPGVPWMRVHFADADLGAASYVTISSHSDGGMQWLDAGSMSEWKHRSAFFNGGALTIELHVAPGDEGVFVRVTDVTLGEPPEEPPAPPGDEPETLCGPDDRVASSDPRIGRISGMMGGSLIAGCTGWMVSNGAFLTAGHCVDTDPDQGGPMLPDGNAQQSFLDGVVEFNVPQSLLAGIVVFAAPEDQYPIDNSPLFNFDGEGQGFGKDWAVFSCGKNSNTGLTPQQVQGAFFRMTKLFPNDGSTIRITGYGNDNTPPGPFGGFNSQNQTQQTNAGPYVGVSTSGQDIYMEYQADSMGGNSGGPIIWEDVSSFAVGIHTNGGCQSNGGGANKGTSFEHDPLETAVQTYFGANIQHVDTVNIVAGDGHVLSPWPSVWQGVSSVLPGGTVSIVSGTYHETMTITTPMKLKAPFGGVSIGN